jgi:hypothetical protein
LLLYMVHYTAELPRASFSLIGLFSLQLFIYLISIYFLLLFSIYMFFL